MTKQKIIFIMPPKKWFYGIDYANSERIVKYFKNNNIFIVYKFEDIEIFFKEKLSFRDFLKLIYIYLFFKINKPQYVFAHNAAYIVNCNLIYKKKILNFFSQILKIRCILRWDHINEQIPNIVEKILNKSNLFKVSDYKEFFLNEINNYKFEHYTWQQNEYYCEKNYLENTLELRDFKLRNLTFFFVNNKIKDNNSLQKSYDDKKIALVGIVDHFSTQKIEDDKLLSIINNKKNFFNKLYYDKLVSYSKNLYLKKKIKLLKIKNMKFYGLNLIKKDGKIEDADQFYSNISKFFMIINPIHPISLTLTSKFYLIYLNGGFCINELPPVIPPKLLKFKELIFYKTEKELIDKIEFFKKNIPMYISIKKEIYEISKNLEIETFNEFKKNFIKS